MSVLLIYNPFLLPKIYQLAYAEFHAFSLEGRVITVSTLIHVCVCEWVESPLKVLQ